MKWILGCLLLIGCSPKVDNRPLGEFELPIDKIQAKAKCESLFERFHGKYETHKYLGETIIHSTLRFEQNCTGAMICGNEFFWECSFNTDDDERGFLIFTSRIFNK